jgi:hypothetical protein
MPRTRPRSVSADDLSVRDDLAAFDSQQRVTSWLIPSSVELCELNGAVALQLSYSDDDQYLRDAGGARAALDRLRRLDGAPDFRVRDFVRAFGSLLVPDDAMGIGYPAVQFRPQGDREAIHPYREIAALLSATTRLASLVRRRQSVAVGDLRVVHHWLASNGLGADYTVKIAAATCERLTTNARGSRTVFDPSLPSIPVGVVNWWLQAKSVRPLLTWRDADRPSVRWTGGLWGLIGAQLMFAVRAGEGLAECDGCGREVRHERRPKAGQLTWCDSIECTRARNREAKRRSRTG